MPDDNEKTPTWGIKAGSLRYPLIVAHRGDVRSAPEIQCRRSVTHWKRGGADAIELDVRLTKDEQLVMFHDWSLKRTSNGDGPVNHYTLKELQSLDVGSWFGPVFQGERPPTLDQVFESLPRDYLVNVEMKVVIKGMKLIAQRVAETIARHCSWGSTLVASFNPVAPTTCARWTRESTADTFGLAIIPIPSTPGASAPLSKPTGTIRPTILMTPDCIASSIAKAGVCWRNCSDLRGNE